MVRFLYLQIGDRSGEASAINNLGNVAFAQDYEAGRLLYAESLAIYTEISDQKGRASALGNLGVAANAVGDYEAARRFYEESLTIYRDFAMLSKIAIMVEFRTVGDQRGIVYSLEAFASLTAHDGKPERAAVLWGAAAALLKKIGSPLVPCEREPYDREVAKGRQVMGEEAFLAAWALGSDFLVEQACQYARESEHA